MNCESSPLDPLDPLCLMAVQWTGFKFHGVEHQFPVELHCVHLILFAFPMVIRNASKGNNGHSGFN